MDLVFLKILNMSISASWLVFVVLALRFLLKKSPRWIHVCLWALVALRLVCPFSFESGLSLNPTDLTKQVVDALPDSYYGDSSIYGYGSENYDLAVSAGVEPQEGDNGYLYVITQPDNPTEPAYTARDVWSYIWVLGMAVMLVYALGSYLRLKRKVSASIDLGNSVYLCDYIDTPFILGIIRPRIYLPSAMEPEAAYHVLAHERAHIARKDHWWKPLGYGLLTIHWFNPVMWLAYILLCRDIELACDEKVVRQMALPQRKSYSDALLKCSVKRMHVAACPLAFGEVGVKERVKTVLNYKKPAFWLVLVAVLALAVTAVCFLTDPVEEADVSGFFLDHVYEQEKDRRPQEEIHFLGAEEGFAAVYCSGMGSFVEFYQYETVDGEPRITASCGGDYNMSGCISVNHVEAEGKHVYYGTVYGSHFDPAEPLAKKFAWKSLRITDSDGKQREIDMEGAQGYLVALDAPLADFQVVSSDGAVILDYAAYTAQGYPIRENKLIRVGTPTTFLGEEYRVDQVLYQNPTISYYLKPEDAPLLQLGEAGSLKYKFDNQDWTRLGGLELVNLPEDFTEWFFGVELGWEGDVSLSGILEDNRESWILYVPNEQDSNRHTFYLLLWQYSGDVYIAQGAKVGSSHTVNCLCHLTPMDNRYSSPYQWTSTLKVWDIRKIWAYQDTNQSLFNTVEGSAMDEFVALLNGVQAHEVINRSINGADDPYWSNQGARVHILCNDGVDILLRYVEDTVILNPETDSGLWETAGYWVIENDALTQWLENIANGGTYMLSDENRDEIRRLVRQEYVQFFCPREYGGYLFVGCAYDHGRGLGVACFEEVAYGYKLVLLLRDEDVKQCASGSDLYYCDFLNMRLFLVMNDSVSGIEFAGGYEASYSIDTYPGLLVEYYPAFLVSMYRFVYGDGNATTMYMDWHNETHAQVPEYDVASLDDPDDAYKVCSNLKASQVHNVWVTENLEVDNRYTQAYTCELTSAQTEELLNLLRALPEDAYEQAECPRVDARFVDIFLTNDRGMMGSYPVLRLKIDQGAVYYQLLLDAENTIQGWKINDSQLLEYLESFYDADISAWNRFAPVVKTEGEVIWSVDGVEITVPKVSCFEYDVSEAGIRFRPAGQEGWVLLQYRTEPYTPEELGLRRFNGMNGGKEVIRGCYGDADEWDFIDITIPAGDAERNVLLLNEEAAPWVAEYYDEIWCIIDQMTILVKTSDG